MPDDLYHCANIIRQVRAPPAETPTTTTAPSISGVSLAAPLVPSGVPTTAVSLPGLGSLPAGLPTVPAFPQTSVASPTLIPPSPTFPNTFTDSGGLLFPGTYATLITSPVVGIPSGTGIGSTICTTRVTRTVRGIL